MSDHKDYSSILNKARRRRRRRGSWNIKLLLIIGGVVLALALIIFAGFQISRAVSARAEKDPDSRTATPADALPAQDSQADEAEQEARQMEEEIQKVIDSYDNLGIVQVSGYVNIRREPNQDDNRNIIGKLSGGGACEVLGTEGEWSHISSGGVEGYIYNQYLLTGEEAKEAARDLVKLRAIITTESLRIRSQPELDASNVIGQALENERYVVLGEEDGWIQIEEGYISADYARVEYALDEGREMDLVAQAINQYDNLVISTVDNYLNVREEPSTDAKVIGKMTSKAAGEILETLDGWYKIKSGPVTGYVSAEFTTTGQEAVDLAMQEAELKAVIRTDVLNVRTEPSTDAKIWTQIVKDERYSVVAQLDGWVQIELDSVDAEDGSESDKAYISTRDNNVEVRYALNEAIKFSPDEIAASNAASLRSRIVNYALQFVGNPYVWGGTSLTNGVDCSGFTMKVLQNFGISLPHYSGSQAQMGKGIKSSQMRPGDLIFYAGSNGRVNHVAMYIGGGQVVHAASAKSGIKISTWNYRSPVAIRNVLGD